MFCKKCGSNLRENAKFCGSCGAVVEVAETGYTAPVEQIPYTAPVDNAAPANQGGHTVPVKKENKAADFGKAAAKVAGNAAKAAGKAAGNAAKAAGDAASKVSLNDIAGKMPKMPKNKKLLPIIGGAVAVVLVLVLVVSLLFGGASGTVVKAFSKSVKAITGIADEMKLPDLAAIAESKKFNQELTAEFTDGDMEGLGIRATFAYNQSGKEAGFVVTPYFEGTNLITGQVKMDGSKIYLGCPELMEKKYIMLDTKTIGVDLADKDLDGLEDLSFNFFELVEKLEDAAALSKNQQKAIEKANSALLKAIEVEKDKKKDIKINSKKISVTLYDVVIPQDALEDYLDALEDVVKDMEPEAVMDVLEGYGFPVDEMGLSYSNDYWLDAIDSLKDAVDELGDLELSVGINGGYVVYLQWTPEIDGDEAELTVKIGGGDNYVDDFSLEFLYNDGNYGTIITSSGNHAMKKGEFTDETVITEIYRGKEEEVFVSEMTWKPSGKSDNFEWVLVVDGDELEIEGTLKCSKDSLSFTAPIELGGNELSVTYTLGAFKAPSIKVGTTLKFADMDEDDLMELAEMIEENGTEWAEMMEDEYPEFVDMLDMLFYYYF